MPGEEQTHARSVLIVGVGAARGLGAAIARRFAKGGFPVVIAGRSAQKLEVTASALKAAAKGALRNLAQSIAREYGPRNIHVTHIIIDGGIEGDRLLLRAPQLQEQRNPDGLLSPDAIAEAYWMLHHQHRSAWTLELDLRPWSENF